MAGMSTFSRLPEPHDRALAELLVDLREGGLDRLGPLLLVVSHLSSPSSFPGERRGRPAVSSDASPKSGPAGSDRGRKAKKKRLSPGRGSSARRASIGQVTGSTLLEPPSGHMAGYERAARNCRARSNDPVSVKGILGQRVTSHPEAGSSPMDARRKKGWTAWPALLQSQIVGGRQDGHPGRPRSPGPQSKQGEAVEGCSVAPEGQGQGSFHRSEVDRKKSAAKSSAAKSPRRPNRPGPGPSSLVPEPRRPRGPRTRAPSSCPCGGRRSRRRCRRGTSPPSAPRSRCRPARCRPRATSGGPCRSRRRPGRPSRCRSSPRPASCWRSRTRSARAVAASSST